MCGRVALLKVLHGTAQERARLPALHAVYIPRRRDGEQLPFRYLAGKMIVRGEQTRRHAESAGDEVKRLSAADAVRLG